MDRDYLIMRELDRWRFCLGRHLSALASFSGQRACNRRLNILLKARYIERQKILYGIPYLYYLSHKGKHLIGANKRKDKFRVAQITHDITVLDMALYVLTKYKISLSDIQTEKQLHSIDGFSTRKHCPDFTFEKNNKIYCVEVELSLKPLERLKQILKTNFTNYDYQLFFINKSNTKLNSILQKNAIYFPNIEILFLENLENQRKD